jgi:demethylmenaquinone methyltransferase/2-methoxy-6-polyprenyl-1,4-benzoquinol methylase
VAQKTTHFGYESIPTDHKTERVGSVFSSVANRYDLMNDLMSFGLHRFWKRLAVARCNIRPNHTVLDLAGGTGDLTRQLAKVLNKNGLVVLADINQAMLTQGRERLINAGLTQTVAYTQANAESIPFGNNTFDRIICAFGLRNVTHPDSALSEMARVLKPGGHAVILEFSTVEHKVIGALYDTYSFSVLPKLGQWICDDADSYRYLAESIRMHPNQETLKSMLDNAGFEKTEYQNLHAGIVALHIGYKF